MFFYSRIVTQYRKVKLKKTLVVLFFALAGVIFFSLNQKSAYVNEESLILGASLPLDGINKELGQEVVQGANAYFSHINARGGVKGKTINLVYYDDKYEPQNTLQNIKTLIEKDRAFALFGFVGTPTVKEILPIIKENDIPFIAPYTGASFLRDSNIENIVNFRSSYKQEIEAVIEHLNVESNINEFAIFYQNDDYGEEGYIATVEALQKRGLSLVSEGTYKRNTLSIRHALNEIQAAKPEAIIIVGAYKPSALFIKKARECCFDNVVFAPISFVNANALMEELDFDGKNVVFSQTVPTYDYKDSKAVSEYLQNLNFYYPGVKPTYTSFESYLAAKAVVTALENIEGNLQRRKFLQEIKNLSSKSLDNIPIEYKNTQLLNRVYISIYHEGEFCQVDEMSFE